LNVDDIRAELRPEQKVEAIREITAKGNRVAMVGDGVNDAPSLAVAHIGVAMGARGADAALEQADVVLMHDRLENFLAAFRLSQRARGDPSESLHLARHDCGSRGIGDRWPNSPDRRGGGSRGQHGGRGHEQFAIAVWRRTKTLITQIIARLLLRLSILTN